METTRRKITGQSLAFASIVGAGLFLWGCNGQPGNQPEPDGQGQSSDGSPTKPDGQPQQPLIPDDSGSGAPRKGAPRKRAPGQGQLPGKRNRLPSESNGLPSESNGLPGSSDSQDQSTDDTDSAPSRGKDGKSRLPGFSPSERQTDSEKQSKDQ